MTAKFCDMEHQISALTSRESHQKLQLEELLRASEEKRIALDARLADETKRHQAFKRSLQDKVELLKDEVLQKTSKYK